MRQYSSFIIAGLGSWVFWLVDSTILSFSHDLEFAAAIGSGAPASRLFLRLIIAALFIFLAWRNYCHKTGRKFLFNFSFTSIQDPPSLCGCAESHLKSERILYHAMRLANYFKMSYEDKDALRLFCYCYNIGQIGIPLSVLESKKELSQKEQELWDNHINIGTEIVKSIPHLSKIAPLVRCYGEYYNGGGVLGIKGENIPLACRIFTVVWIYDYLIYPPGRTNAMVCYEALEELTYYANTVLDPEVLEAFIKLMGAKKLFAVNRRHIFSWH
ncbi:MAG: HD-GYP domain-containing protein [Bacillota bacterium]|jgi:hypothetical protein